MPIGSIGQYPETPDYVENVLFENVVLFDSSSAAWIKTWPGVNVLTSGNGDSGGGGGGSAKNITWRNFQFFNLDQPVYVTQCIYNADPSICDTSKVCNFHCLNLLSFSKILLHFCSIQTLDPLIVRFSP